LSVSFLQKKLSYEVETLSNQKRSNFYFDLSLKLSQGEVHNFSGEVQKFSGEVQNDLRGGAAPPHTSPQNPAMEKMPLRRAPPGKLKDERRIH
jgi:hypothetical protein